MNAPRVMIAAPASGQGKTTVAVGLMAALAQRGLAVGAAKVGPDYIDPGYHALATGRPSRNLDPFLTTPETALGLLHRAALVPTAADVTVVEGVMGLFDGRLAHDGFASSAHLAALSRTPVVLVVDVSHTSRTVGALVHGLATFDPGVHVGGVVLNKTGSPRHADEARRAVESLGLPVVGVIGRDVGLHVPSRHLGLVPAAEQDGAAQTLEHIAEAVSAHVELDAVLAIARSAPALPGGAWTPQDALATCDAAARPTADDPREDAPVIAVSGGRAFTFRYPETVELLEAAGARVEIFDPVRDTALPPGTSALYLGGGFPEVHAKALSHNLSLLRDVRDAVTAGLPTVAECAGLLYLCRELDGHAMAGALDARAGMHPRLTLGYREATLERDSVIGSAGTAVRGHEFHRTRTDPEAGRDAAWRFTSPAGAGVREGFAVDPAGTGRASLVASYLHTHWAGSPAVATHLTDAARTWAASGRGSDLAAQSAAGATRHRLAAEPALMAVAPDPSPERAAVPAQSAHDLDHHGDRELDGTLVDLAVNVRVSEPPAWLAAHLRDAVSGLAAYPDPSAATRALARHHGVDPGEVLLTNGADEAFTLVARSGLTGRPLVVHPQFTEPEAALRRAGLDVERLLLRADTGFRLPAAPLADSGHDLVVIGNPTNPTGALHPRRAVAALRGPGRRVLVDEAFMDAVPGEAESMLTGQRPEGVIVVRSLTKTWGLAGLRIGYVVADAPVIAALRACAQQWPVNHLALVAAEAVTSPAAVAEQARAAQELQRRCAHLVTQLTRLGVRTAPTAAPFVLAQLGYGVRDALRGNGFAVRRGDTFPGLDGSWARIAARDELTTDAFVTALTRLRTRSVA